MITVSFKFCFQSSLNTFIRAAGCKHKLLTTWARCKMVLLLNRCSGEILTRSLIRRIRSVQQQILVLLRENASLSQPSSSKATRDQRSQVTLHWSLGSQKHQLSSSLHAIFMFVCGYGTHVSNLWPQEVQKLESKLSSPPPIYPSEQDSNKAVDCAKVIRALRTPSGEFFQRIGGLGVQSAASLKVQNLRS